MVAISSYTSHIDLSNCQEGQSTERVDEEKLDAQFDLSQYGNGYPLDISCYIAMIADNETTPLVVGVPWAHLLVNHLLSTLGMRPQWVNPK
eukprot:Ihof_evm1s1249 gene=Ihof_evmTU1s1249